MRYHLTPRAGVTDVTEFTRTLSYPLPNLVYALLDALVIRRRVRAESELAVRQLKQRLEAA